MKYQIFDQLLFFCFYVKGMLIAESKEPKDSNWRSDTALNLYACQKLYLIIDQDQIVPPNTTKRLKHS